MPPYSFDECVIQSECPVEKRICRKGLRLPGLGPGVRKLDEAFSYKLRQHIEQELKFDFFSNLTVDPDDSLDS